MARYILTMPERSLEPPEPTPTPLVCRCCEEHLYDDEEVIEFDGEYYHEECFSDNLLKIVGAARHTISAWDY